MSGVEKRTLTRFDLELPARLKLAGGDAETGAALDLKTKDISAGGAFFHTESPLSVGTEVQIDLILPLDQLRRIEGVRAHIRVSGAVIRTTEEGMAICFENGFDIKPMPQETPEWAKAVGSRAK